MVDQMGIIEEYRHRVSRNNIISQKPIEIFLLIILPTIHQTILPMVVDRECTTQTECEVATRGVEDLGSKHPLVGDEAQETLIRIIMNIVEALRGLTSIKGDGNRVVTITPAINGIEARVPWKMVAKCRLPVHQSQRRRNPPSTTPRSPRR